MIVAEEPAQTAVDPLMLAVGKARIVTAAEIGLVLTGLVEITLIRYPPLPTGVLAGILAVMVYVPAGTPPAATKAPMFVALASFVFYT